MFRKSFWFNEKVPQIQQKRNNYMFASARRVRQRFSRPQNRNQVLNSTSAGVSTIDVYIQRELGDEQFVFEDPDYQMTSNPPPHTSLQITAGEVDLEKGGAFKTEITWTDIGFPRAVGGSEAGGSAGSGDTRSSGSR